MPQIGGLELLLLFGTVIFGGLLVAALASIIRGAREPSDSDANRKRTDLRLLAVAVGVLTGVLLFPYENMTQCSLETGSGGECTDWSQSILVRYSGDNALVGVAVALGAAVWAAILVYLLARWMSQKRA